MLFFLSFFLSRERKGGREVGDHFSAMRGVRLRTPFYLFVLFE